MAAGDCAIPVRGRVLSRLRNWDDRLVFYGFMMDLGTPICNVPVEERGGVMQQMISVMERLHAKGIVHGDVKLENMLLTSEGMVRFCDFGEGRYVDEDERVWEGNTMWDFESPNRLRRAEAVGREPAPPVVEDDLYGLGLSIWQLYTGGVPHGETAWDDLGLKERQRRGETVDVSVVEDLEAREIIRGLLRGGGAWIGQEVGLGEEGLGCETLGTLGSSSAPIIPSSPKNPFIS